MQAAAAGPRPLWKTFLVFLGPLVLTNMLQALSGTLNNIYVGQMLGIGALAAVASFFPLLMFFVAFVIGLGSGGLVSRNLRPPNCRQPATRVLGSMRVDDGRFHVCMLREERH